MRTSLSLYLLLAVPFSAKAEAPLSTSKCEPASDGTCAIAWDFTSEPGTYYQVQRFNPEMGFWINVESTSISPNGTTKASVPGGFLYRALACSDIPGKPDCASSTVYWAPIKVDNADLIPATMDDPIGGEFLVSKNLDLMPQLLEYNVYSLAQVVGSIKDLSILAPMTSPPEWDSAPPFHDVVHFNVFDTYDGVQKMHAAARAQSRSE